MLYSVFRQMVRFPKYFPACFSGIAPHKLGSRKVSASGLAGLALTLSLVVGGCATAPDTVVIEPSPAPATQEPSKQTPPPVEEPSKKPAVMQPDGQASPDKPSAADDEMVTVSVYTIDDQCNDFVEQSVRVPSGKAINEAVGQAMSAVDYNAFKLAGYQVSINGKTAVVDMQLAPSSQRQFVSLSSCEQRSLFGSVEETLLNNADWNVNAVKFTNQGKELML